MVAQVSIEARLTGLMPALSARERAVLILGAFKNKTPEELRKYFQEYRRRAPLDYLRHRVQYQTAQAIKTRIDADSQAFRLAQKTWWFIRRHLGA